MNDLFIRVGSKVPEFDATVGGLKIFNGQLICAEETSLLDVNLNGLSYNLVREVLGLDKISKKNSNPVNRTPSKIPLELDEAFGALTIESQPQCPPKIATNKEIYQTTTKKEGGFFCKVCKKGFAALKTYDQHLKSSKHLEKEKFERKKVAGNLNSRIELSHDKTQHSRENNSDCTIKVRSALTKAKELIANHQAYNAISLLWNFAEKLWIGGNIKCSYDLVTQMLSILMEMGVSESSLVKEVDGLTVSQIRQMLYLGYTCVFNISHIFSPDRVGSLDELRLLSNALSIKFFWGLLPPSYTYNLSVLAREASLKDVDFKGEQVLRKTIQFLYRTGLDDVWRDFLCWVGFYCSEPAKKGVYLKTLILTMRQPQPLSFLAEACLSVPDFAKTPESVLIIEALLIQGLLIEDFVLVDSILSKLKTNSVLSLSYNQTLLAIANAALSLDFTTLYKISCQKLDLCSENGAFLSQLASKVVELNLNIF